MMGRCVRGCGPWRMSGDGLAIGVSTFCWRERGTALPQRVNQRWSLDFVSDALACGRRFRVLAVVDDFTRECLPLVADTSLSGLRV